MRCDSTSILDSIIAAAVSIPAGFSDALRHAHHTPPADPPYKFQSLLGFLMRCDLIRERSMSHTPPLFQSLLGFLMRCDLKPTEFRHAYSEVSIPAGFSDALRPFFDFCVVCHSSVSIPAGFSDALRLPPDKRKHEGRHDVSIPAGFSDALRHVLRPVLIFVYVSIPAGFSDALRHKHRYLCYPLLRSFNPCWVF